MDGFFIGFFVFCYILLGLITLLGYRCDYEENTNIKKLNPDNARNIRIYLRLVVLFCWPLLWVYVILMDIIRPIPRIVNILFKGLYRFITE